MIKIKKYSLGSTVLEEAENDINKLLKHGWSIFSTHTESGWIVFVLVKEQTSYARGSF